MMALSALVDKRFRHGHRPTTKSHEHTEGQLVALVALEDGHSISALGARLCACTPPSIYARAPRPAALLRGRVGCRNVIAYLPTTHNLGCVRNFDSHGSESSESPYEDDPTDSRVVPQISKNFRPLRGHANLESNLPKSSATPNPHRSLATTHEPCASSLLRLFTYYS